MRFDRNDYSVPSAFAHHELTVVGGIEQVRIVCGTHLVATHPRCWEKEQTTFDPPHYLALLERKPGALDVARPLEDWDLPGCFALLRTSTWGWGGRTWVLVHNSTRPEAAYASALAPDPTTGGDVLFQALPRRCVRQPSTWIWRDLDWTRASVSGGPATNGPVAMVWDEALRRIVLFDSEGSVWTWTGKAWSQLTAGRSRRGL